MILLHKSEEYVAKIALSCGTPARSAGNTVGSSYQLLVVMFCFSTNTTHTRRHNSIWNFYVLVNIMASSTKHSFNHRVSPSTPDWSFARDRFSDSFLVSCTSCQVKEVNEILGLLFEIIHRFDSYF